MAYNTGGQFEARKPGILKSGPLLQSLAVTLIKLTWAC